MKSLYLFNPENDMALAYGGPYYMPPSNARKMAHDLAALPLWYAVGGAHVWLPEERQKAWMAEYGLPFPACGTLSLDSSYECVLPWGWSASIVHRLRQEGITEKACPSPERLEHIRCLSSRATAVDVLAGMNIPCCTGQSKVLVSMEETVAFVEGNRRFLLKAPWSGSGRGIQLVEGELTPPLQGWVKHILKTQGYVVGEPLYNKVMDFAMEFRMHQGKASFAGYSFFETDARGIYKGNWLAADEVIEKRLSVYVPCEVLSQIKCHLKEKLTEVFGDSYDGYLGVDMMVCRTEEGYAVHPCVEINLRMNMGMLSRLLYDRYVSPETQGRFVIEYYPSQGEALRMHRMLQSEHPLVMEGKKIRQGYLSLTPVFDDTAYQAYVVID